MPFNHGLGILSDAHIESAMQYKIPDEWLEFCEFKPVQPEYRFYAYSQGNTDIEAVPIAEIEPPTRSPGTPPFKKFKIVPVLMALMDPDGRLPPIAVSRMPLGSKYQYKLTDGFHRYYAAALAGYTLIPAVVSPSQGGH